MTNTDEAQSRQALWDLCSRWVVYLGLGIWSLWAILRNEGFIGTPDVDAYGTL